MGKLRIVGGVSKKADEDLATADQVSSWIQNVLGVDVQMTGGVEIAPLDSTTFKVITDTAEFTVTVQ